MLDGSDRAPGRLRGAGRSFRSARTPPPRTGCRFRSPPAGRMRSRRCAARRTWAAAAWAAAPSWSAEPTRARGARSWPATRTSSPPGRRCSTSSTSREAGSTSRGRRFRVFRSSGPAAIRSWPGPSTNARAVTVDLYTETLDPADPSRYHDGRGWRELEERVEVLRVRGDDDETLTVRSTRHGPLLDPLLGDERAPLALAWAGARVGAAGGLPAWLAVARSRGEEELLAALARVRRAGGRGGLRGLGRRGRHAGGGLDPPASAPDRSGAARRGARAGTTGRARSSSRCSRAGASRTGAAGRSRPTTPSRREATARQRSGCGGRGSARSGSRRCCGRRPRPGRSSCGRSPSSRATSASRAPAALVASALVLAERGERAAARGERADRTPAGMGRALDTEQRGSRSLPRVPRRV